MPLHLEDIADLVAVTEKAYSKEKFTDLSFDEQDYPMAKRLMKKNKRGMNSHTYEFDVLTDDGDLARNVGLYEVDQPNQVDGVIKGSVNWVHADSSTSLDIRTIAANELKHRIIEFVKLKRHQQKTSLVKLIEANAWSKPSSADDPVEMKKPFGVPYWVVKSATTPTGGFTGGNPSGFTSGCAGINSSVYTNWSNWSANYTNMTKEDLIKAWRKAATYTKFLPPVESAGLNSGDKYAYYTNYAVVSELESLLEKQNDNLGNDVASKDGMALFRRTPILWVPKLDTDTTNPIYGINWGVFFTAYLNGHELRETKSIAPMQHNVINYFQDTTYQIACVDRRRLFVLYTPA